MALVVVMFAACSKKETASEISPATPVAMKDFFREPESGQYRISPNGEMIIFTAPHNGRSNVFIRRLSDTTAVRITNETERSIYDAYWESDERIIYLKDIGGDENMHILSVKPDGTELKDHTPFPKVRSLVLDILEDKPNEILILSNKRDPKAFDVYSLNLQTDEMKMVARNPGSIIIWVTDHEGKVRAAVTAEGVTKSLLYRENEDLPFQEVISTSFKDKLLPYLFTFDNKKLYCGSNLGRDKVALIEFDPIRGKETNVLYENPDVDVEGVDFSRKRKVLTTVFYQTEKPQKHFLDSETAAIYEGINAKLPNYDNQIIRKSKEEDKLIVYSNSDRYYGGYYLYETGADKFGKLADLKPWLIESNMAEMKPIAYQSRDGLTINGYLTLPKGVEPRNLPVVVNPHGGPWWRDGWFFNPEVQFLANRGYAVLQMNFRGSTGYGRKFWEASFKQWGRAMQDDITDGVKWLINEGIADPKRVAIYGGSYGGYATLAGVTLTPELYACAIDYVGVANMFTFMNTFPPYWEPTKKMWYEMVGDPVKDSLMLAEVSPVHQAHKIRCPLFIAQGANDPRVNKAESDQMVEALRKRGIAVEYMVKDDEGHGFYNEENQFDFYGAMEKFLEKHLKPINPNTSATAL